MEKLLSTFMKKFLQNIGFDHQFYKLITNLARYDILKNHCSYRATDVLYILGLKFPRFLTPS